MGFEELEYPNAWVELELLDQEFLREQLERYRAGEDKNTEHYRYAAFLRLLEKEPFSDAFVDRFVRLAAADPDRVMGESAIIQLLHRHPFSDAQFAALCARPELSHSRNGSRARSFAAARSEHDSGQHALHSAPRWPC
jgi:hypothetical protein